MSNFTGLRPRTPPCSQPFGRWGPKLRPPPCEGKMSPPQYKYGLTPLYVYQCVVGVYVWTLQGQWLWWVEVWSKAWSVSDSQARRCARSALWWWWWCEASHPGSSSAALNSTLHVLGPLSYTHQGLPLRHPARSYYTQQTELLCTMTDKAMKTWITNGVLLRNRQIHGESTVIPSSENMFVAVIVEPPNKYTSIQLKYAINNINIRICVNLGSSSCSATTVYIVNWSNISRDFWTWERIPNGNERCCC